METMKSLTAATALTILAACAGCSLLPGQAAKPVPSPTQGMTLLSGKVVETFDGGGYTYVNLLKDGKNTWVAAPVMQVVVGQELELLPGAVMPNFTSKSLGRTFDNIVFSGGLPSQLNPPAKPAAGAAATAAAAADNGPAEAEEAILAGTVIETITASNYIYLRIEKDGKASWAAVPRTDIAVGDEVELAPGTPMGEFSSKTLNRTFNSIYFAGGVEVTKKSAKAPAAPQAKPAAAAPAATAATAADANSSPLPSGHPKIDAAEMDKAVEKAAAAAAAAAAAPITGKVIETANAGGYTYICVEKDAVKTWVAVPPMEVKVGEEVALNPGNVMTNFSSKTLNRTFDKIIFSSGPAAK
ncbi:hypothetical protein [Geomonas anaerohicana]|uniref:DUF5666 domain-containing protein n=1 Tax=Geomonas anaerohicana TaxID=2798583 RepID=A0ABS0YH19_9BACT|nr:hypothetical protein [Geomonas anaerohicana]MBJ6751566.1 hypothetical protein [Geomonas anaerohicana]